MSKENTSKILAKAQKLQHDPGQLENSRLLGGWSYGIGAIICTTIILARVFIKNQLIADSALVLFGMYTFFFWGSYLKNEKKKSDLLYAIFSSVIFVILTVIFIKQMV